MNTNKKQMLKRICAAVLAVITVAGTLPEGLGTVHAATYKTYGKPYTIANVLTDYSYFVSGNVVGDSSSHTVGAVAVGGVLSIANNIGNAQLAPSYIDTIDMSAMTDFPQSNWIPTGSKDLYYKTLSGDPYNSKSWMVQRFTYNPDYIDFDTAFKSLQTESKNLAKSATAVSASEGTLTIDFTSTKSVSVSASDLNGASSVVIKGLTLEKIKSNRYVINVTGKDAVKFSCNSVTIADENKPLGNLLKSMKDATEGGQLNTTGMKLIWNFPEATSVTATSLGGHLVAPNADVRLDGGNFEGNIIAKSVSASAEGHFFSYGNGGDEEPEEPTTPDPGEDTKTATIKLIKTGGFGALVGAKFTLYSSYADSSTNTVYSKTSGDESKYKNVATEIDYDTSSATYKKAVVTFDVTAPTEQDSVTYYLKETAVPDNSGYTLNDTVYYCKVSKDGKVTYSTTENGTYTSVFPTCENTLKTINLIKMDPDGKALAGAKFQLYKDGTVVGNEVEATVNTTEDSIFKGYAVVTFTGTSEGKFDEGTYTFKEAKTPNGYTIPDKEAKVYYAKVDSKGNVTYSVDGGEKYTADFPTCTNNTVSLSITKTDTDGMPLQDAVIGLYSGGTLKYQVVTDKNGKATFTHGSTDLTGTKIELTTSSTDTYTIKEVTPPTGYQLSETEVSVSFDGLGHATYKIDSTETTNPTIEDESSNDAAEETKIELNKTDGSNVALKGAAFGLYSDETCTVLVATQTSGSDGKVTFEKMSGNTQILYNDTTYYVKEISAPEGYDVSTDVIVCKIDNGGKVTYQKKGSDDQASTDALTVKNTKKNTVAKLLVKKYKNSTSGGGLGGAQFGLYNNYYADTLGATLVPTGLMATATSDSDGIVKFENSASLPLYRDATYYIKEIGAPAGYNINDSLYQIAIDKNGNATYKVLTYNSDAKGANYTSSADATTEDSESMKAIQCIDQELTANDNVKITLNKRDDKNKTLSGATFGLYSYADCSGTAIATAVSDTDGVVTFDSNTNTDIKVPNESGSVIYYIKETKAPSGYTASDEIYAVRITTAKNDSSATYTVEYKLSTQSDFAYSKNELTCVNQPVSVMVKKIGSTADEALTGATFGLYSDAACSKLIAQKKTSMVTSYAAAVFKSGESDGVTSSGEINLEAGKTYYVKEIQAPSGYKASDAVYAAKIETDGTVQYTNYVNGSASGSMSTAVPVVQNTKIGDGATISLIKVDTNKDAVAGATFALYDSYSDDSGLGTVVATAKSEKQVGGAYDGKAVVSFISGNGDLTLQNGKSYYLAETSAPTGYGKSDYIWQCTISRTGQVYYRVVAPEAAKTSYSTSFPECVNTIVPIPNTPDSNDPGDPGSSDPGDPDTPGTSVTPKPSPKTPGTVTITYEDDPVENGTVVVENEDGEEITVTTGENGEFYIEPGTYKIISINGTKVPDGYVVTVDEGGTASVAVLGRRRSPKTGQLPIVPMAAGTVVIIGAAIYVLDRKRRESK